MFDSFRRFRNMGLGSFESAALAQAAQLRELLRELRERKK